MAVARRQEILMSTVTMKTAERGARFDRRPAPNQAAGGRHGIALAAETDPPSHV